MRSKTTLTDAEVYDLLHDIWLRIDGLAGGTEHGEVAIRRVLNTIQVQQGNLVANMERLAREDGGNLS